MIKTFLHWADWKLYRLVDSLLPGLFLVWAAALTVLAGLWVWYASRVLMGRIG